MKKIASAGRSFQQGWNSPSASLDEKPGMTSSFTYDYWMDTTEVTQKHYFEVMRRHPVVNGSAYGVGDENPVYYVSWFDAALFCNARSKAEGIDTVYMYSGIKSLSSGSVYELTGLLYDITRDGYRLPTEAEWEYAARGGTSALPFCSSSDSSYACSYAWFDGNSSGTTHVVASRLSNSLGLYDLAGNVFEWTNDWKGLYDGKSISNSLGALQPNKDYEKIIKGGSYNFPLMYLRPSHRLATYPTLISTANEYVGFRCARGPIMNGQYIGSGQSSFTPNPVTIVTSCSDFRSYIGTSEAKFVFVNVTGTNRTLCYVDFTKTFPYVQEYLDDNQVYMPTISPDGKYVAYCSNNEGLSGPSKVSIRSLDSLKSPIATLSTDSAYIPRWWVDPTTTDTFIIYTNSAVLNGNEALWRSTETFLQKIQGGQPVGDATVLVGNGSYHDGLSLNKRYIVTGYNRLMMKDFVNVTEQQLFLSPANGKDMSGSTQVCNVSISPDTGNDVHCMFLDFGSGGKTSTVTGCKYGVHEYLFVSKMTDSITEFMRCPDGEQSWNNTEWSNRAPFGVGCGCNGAEESHAIYAIDIDNKRVQQALSGTELEQPGLWIGFLVPNPSHFAMDSIGRYNDPPNSSFQACLATKLLMFWRFFDSLEVVILGSSQPLLGINPTLITGLKSYNMAAYVGDLLGQEKLILNYILKHCPHIKVVCSGIEIGWLNLEMGNFTWNDGVAQSKGYLYDSCHAFWDSRISSDYTKIVNEVPLPIPEDTQNLGFHASVRNYFDTIPQGVPQVGGNTWDTTDFWYQTSIATIITYADTMRARGVHWVAVLFPVIPSYKSTDYYSYFGPTWPVAHQIIEKLRTIEAANPYFHLYDAYMYGNNDYTYDEFYDWYHLNSLGAVKLTTRVDSVFHSILGY